MTIHTLAVIITTSMALVICSAEADQPPKANDPRAFKTADAGTAPDSGMTSLQLQHKVAGMRFEIEGLRLGMLRDQVIPIMLSRGFDAMNETGAMFTKQDAAPASKTRVTIKYNNDLDSDVHPVSNISLKQDFHARESESRADSFSALKAQFSERYDATNQSGKKPCAGASCRWKHHYNGWSEDLTLTTSNRSITLRIRSSIRDSAKLEQADALTSFPGTAPPELTFDALAPFGVAIGQDFAGAASALERDGFTLDRCSTDLVSFDRADGFGRLTVKVGLVGAKKGHGDSCDIVGGLIKNVFVNDLSVTGYLTTQEARTAQLSAQIGSEAKCTGRVNVSCSWTVIDKDPLVLRITFRSGSKNTDYQIYGIANLENQVDIPDITLPEDAIKTWWTSELEEAQTVGLSQEYAATPEFKSLPAADQARLNNEAKQVFDYCNGRDLFASLHDCSCVANKTAAVRAVPAPAQPQGIACGETDWERFNNKMAARNEIAQCPDEDQACVDAINGRILACEEHARQSGARGPENASRQELITLADSIADQCPNGAGAAKYAFDSCISSYNHRLSEAARIPYCTCYGDTFASTYMEDPRSFMPRITKVATVAKSTCDAKGLWITK